VASPTGMRWWALFRRPLGLPIPHTAIIQGNQHRIADQLGEFIEVHFLEAAPVEARLRQIDFGSFIADWLARPQAQCRSRALYAATSARGGLRDGNLRPDDLHHPHASPPSCNRSISRRSPPARCALSCKRAGTRVCLMTSCAAFMNR